MNLSLHLDGILIRETESGTHFAVHAECHDKLEALNIATFLVIGPTELDPGPCNFGQCEH